MSNSTSYIPNNSSNFHAIQQRLLESVNCSPKSPLIIAYSGGVDSQVILHTCFVLQKAKVLLNPISVCHVNHGLSPHATQWENNAKRYCDEYGFSLEIKRVQLDRKPQESLEGLARDARYAALCEYAPDNAFVVTGHHGDDQIETFLLALKRGSGLKGLSAMKKCSPLYGYPSKSLSLLRPLLKVSRDDILAYAKEYKLSWVEDESNSDINFERNFLRHKVIPTLKQKWPSFIHTLFRSTEHIQESQRLLDELAEQDLQHCFTNAKRFSVQCLLSLSQARFNNLLRFYIAMSNWRMPSTEQLDQAYQQIHATQGRSAEVKLGDIWLRVFKNEVYFTPLLLDLSEWQHEVIHEESVREKHVLLPDNLGELYFQSQSSSEVPLKSGKCAKHIGSEARAIKTHRIMPPSKGQKVEITFIHSNPKCQPEYRDKSRPLKKVLQELSLPPWQRKQVPFLYYDGELVAALGYFVCKPFIPNPQAQAWVVTYSTQ